MFAALRKWVGYAGVWNSPGEVYGVAAINTGTAKLKDKFTSWLTVNVDLVLQFVAHISGASLGGVDAVLSTFGHYGSPQLLEIGRKAVRTLG